MRIAKASKMRSYESSVTQVSSFMMSKDLVSLGKIVRVQGESYRAIIQKRKDDLENRNVKES